ncbi:MAG: phenylalanine--tRNA ligase subunit beta [Candidatus Micrarchaeia archaeon]
MAIIETSVLELKNLIGPKVKGLSAKQIADGITMMGLPVDKHDSNTLWVEVSPNRPDCYSVEGLARALSAFLGIKTGLQNYNVNPAKTELKVDSSIKNCPREEIVCAVARNVKLTDDLLKSLIQIQEKLHDTLGRKRKKASIGIHDLSKVKPHFTYKAVKPTQAKFIPLDMRVEKTLEEILLEHPKGVEYAKVLEGAKNYPLIVDAEGQVLSFPPIINGELTKVTENTTELFIEITATDKKAATDSLNILCTLLSDRKAQVERVKISGLQKETTPDLSPKNTATSTKSANKLLGTTIQAKECIKLLEKMGYAAQEKSGKISVSVPVYRNDVLHEVDVIEDIGIAYGFEKFFGTGPRFATIGQKHPQEEFADKARRTMIGLGFQDCITFMLSNERREYAKMLSEETPRVEIANPLTEETTMLRTSLLPSLLGVLENNKDQKYPQTLFEVGEVLLLDEKNETGARTAKKLCMVSAHKNANLAEAKSTLEALMRELNEKPAISSKQEPFFIQGRSAKVKTQSGKFTGSFGEIHPKVLEQLGIEMPVSAFELFLE